MGFKLLHIFYGKAHHTLMFFIIQLKYPNIYCSNYNLKIYLKIQFEEVRWNCLTSIS